MNLYYLVCGGLILLEAFGLLCVASLCKIKALSDIEAERMLKQRMEKIRTDDLERVNHG